MTRFLPTIQKAVQLHQAGKLDEAAALYQQVLTLEPLNAGVVHLLGLVAHHRGRHAEAAETIQQAIAIDDRPVEFYVNLASALIAIQRFEEAVAASQKALERNAREPAAHNNLAAALTGLGRFDEAIIAAQQAMALRPGYPEAVMALAAAMLAKNQADDAVRVLTEAIERSPTHPGPMVNLADILWRNGRSVRAVELCRRAVGLKPGVEALVNLGNGLYELAQPEEAYRTHRKAVELQPASPRARSNFLLGLNYVPGLAPEEVFREHQVYGRQCVAPPRSRPFFQTADTARPLRIGYVSADFCRHSVAYFLEPILANHDRAAFHVTGYSNARYQDDVSARLSCLCDQFRPITFLNDEQAEALILQDRIDILVDLGGHTLGNRLTLMARKPAPLQIAYLGYPNTTGLPAIDYRITDDLADPPGVTERFHVELLARLPAPFLCYLPPDPTGAPDPGQPPCDMHGGVTFASFNNTAKINPSLIALWARILLAAPDARLLLKSRTLAEPEFQATLASAFAAHGVASDRLEFAGFQPVPADHLAAYRRVDIALDTFPYHGTTTTCEALFMGIPVISRVGQVHASRVGASLLTSMGLTDCLANSDDAYVARAVALAADRSLLRQLRGYLRQRLLTSPLCDGPGFTRRFESLCRDLWAERNR